MTNIGFHGGDRPALNAKGLSNLVDNMRFGLSVLQRASAVGRRPH